ncbi:MAG: hypothetical protein JWN08_2061 [Frankiales bacterium]|nr:hypothetical protein [Frankiales bacterium]
MASRTVDELGSEPRTASRRTRLLVAAVVVLVVTALVADREQRDRESDELLAAVTAAEAVVLDSQRSQAALAEYQAALLGGDVLASARASAYDLFATDARRWLPRLDAPARAVETTGVLPWHGDLRRARDAYALRLQRWVEVLERTATAPEQARERPEEVARSRKRARDALLAVGSDVLGEGRTGGPG